MTEKETVVDESMKTYFINTPVDKKMFKDVKAEAHRLQLNRAEYIRGLINKDLNAKREARRESSQEVEV